MTYYIKNRQASSGQKGLRVAKTEGENNDHLISRFRKNIRAARIVQELKQQRFYHKKLTKTEIRNQAIMRKQYRKKRAQEAYME